MSTGSDIQDIEIASGATLSGSVDSVPVIDTATGNLTTTGTLLNDESNIDLSQKPILQKTDEHPEREILVQFKSDIDGYIGQYQIDQIENTHDLTTTETISEQNIAVMEIDTPTAIDTVSSMSVVDTLAQT